MRGRLRVCSHSVISASLSDIEWKLLLANSARRHSVSERRSRGQRLAVGCGSSSIPVLLRGHSDRPDPVSFHVTGSPVWDLGRSSVIRQARRERNGVLFQMAMTFLRNVVGDAVGPILLMAALLFQWGGGGCLSTVKYQANAGDLDAVRRPVAPSSRVRPGEWCATGVRFVTHREKLTRRVISLCSPDLVTRFGGPRRPSLCGHPGAEALDDQAKAVVEVGVPVRRAQDVGRLRQQRGPRESLVGEEPTGVPLGGVLG
ncbi:hypothetical protein NOGI109294_03035 [Nocardiopsis gilva]